MTLCMDMETDRKFKIMNFTLLILLLDFFFTLLLLDLNFKLYFKTSVMDHTTNCNDFVLLIFLIPLK